eukprot:6159751-Pleurochrysis_carterae.AAC.1
MHRWVVQAVGARFRSCRGGTRLLAYFCLCLLDVTLAAPVGSVRLSEDLYKDVMRNVPISTVDVLIFSPDLEKTLLFKRQNPPVQHVYYSVGGRLLKNERLRHAAVRKLSEETKLVVAPRELVLGGVVEEVFSDSMFANSSINSHCINSVFGLVLHSMPSNIGDIVGDKQHTDAAWFDIHDSSLHPYMQRKIFLLQPKLVQHYAASQMRTLEDADTGSTARQQRKASRKERVKAKKAVLVKGG